MKTMSLGLLAFIIIGSKENVHSLPEQNIDDKLRANFRLFDNFEKLWF